MRRGAGYLAALLLVAGAFAAGFFLTQTESGASQSAPPVRADRPVRLIDEVRAELTSSYYRWIEPAVLERPTVDGILAGLGLQTAEGVGRHAADGRQHANKRLPIPPRQSRISARMFSHRDHRDNLLV